MMVTSGCIEGGLTREMLYILLEQRDLDARIYNGAATRLRRRRNTAAERNINNGRCSGGSAAPDFARADFYEATT